MTAEALAKALGGRKAGTGWMARCPAHEDREPSLSIAEAAGGKVLVRCHAGCDQRDVITALRARGLWDASGHKRSRLRPKKDYHPCPGKLDSDATKHTEAARAIWEGSRSAPATLVATYFRSRGITISPPPTIRFRRWLKHPSGLIWPAMVALVTRGADDEPIAIHRTFLAPDGSGKAPVESAKMMLGSCRGGAVRLAPVGEPLMVGEGIETCLAAMQATGHSAWAALSTSGLRSLDLPPDARDVIVLADGDAPGEAAAMQCARRWKREGRRVRIARPPQGLDFNDLLERCSPPLDQGSGS